jgi:hypothetical protein
VSELIPLSERIFVATDFAVLVLEPPVVVLPPVGIAWVEVAVEVDATLAGRLDKAMSVV